MTRVLTHRKVVRGVSVVSLRVEPLRRLATPIPGVRPALFSQDAYRLLDTLRAFRRFFRHAYSFDLDERRIRLVLDDALKLKDLYRVDLDRFLLALEE